MGKKNETERVYDILKQRIIYLEYGPGMVLNEVDISTEFDISRTPIREAFQKLSNDNLLNIIPRFGAQVSHIDFRYMKSVFEVTREFEPFAVKLAIERISDEQIKELEEIIDRLKAFDIKEDYKKAIMEDEKFHKITIENCKNPCLQKILYDLHNHTERLWHYSKHYFDSMDIFTVTLGNVLEAIKERNPEKAEIYTRDHIDAFVRKIKEEML